MAKLRKGDRVTYGNGPVTVLSGCTGTVKRIQRNGFVSVHFDATGNETVCDPLFLTEDRSFDTTPPHTLKPEISRAIESGYKVQPWAEFLSDAPTGYVKRAEKFITPDVQNYVVWDPFDNDDGFLIVGTNVDELVKELIDGPLSI